MTRQELNKHFWLKHEIESQRKRLRRLEEKPYEGTVGDTVRDYKSGKGIPVLIQGIPTEEFTRPVMIGILKEEVEKNIQELESAAVEIEQFVQEIEDPKLREVMRCRFLDHMKWEEVGESNFIAPDYARRMVREFLRTL